MAKVEFFDECTVMQRWEFTAKLSTICFAHAIRQYWLSGESRLQFDINSFLNLMVQWFEIQFELCALFCQTFLPMQKELFYNDKYWNGHAFHTSIENHGNHHDSEINHHLKINQILFGSFLAILLIDWMQFGSLQLLCQIWNWMLLHFMHNYAMLSIDMDASKCSVSGHICCCWRHSNFFMWLSIASSGKWNLAVMHSNRAHFGFKVCLTFALLPDSFLFFAFYNVSKFHLLYFLHQCCFSYCKLSTPIHLFGLLGVSSFASSLTSIFVKILLSLMGNLFCL